MAKKGRTFVRGLDSQTYGLGDQRRTQLAAPRVRDDSVVTDTGDSAAHASTSAKSRTWWRVGPGDEPFLTQTVQIHFVELPPDSSNSGHGHQNEAAFYILEGRGYEIHDDQRYDWKQGDLVFVHTDSVHRHWNPYDERAVAIVMKAKSLWMFMGLIQQGRSAPIDRPQEFGEREDWSRVWTPGVRDRKKVITEEDGAWEQTPMGLVRVMNSKEQADHRQFSVDVYEQRIEPGSRSGRYWKMADEIFYVLSGSGYSLHWEVEAEIADKYYARVAKEPTRHEITAGDTLYVPQNTVVQHFAADGSPLQLLNVQNRVFKYLGYDTVHYFEDAPAAERNASARATV
ncbi:cupin domain-containing protein [uncultured Jatrophihabitans sp.]|uniref:cupin domain-containing protein n=1 Tax=uncultured Jatrophihabitans sp. TaxID=1610747 RepID=UPI0035C9BEC0